MQSDGSILLDVHHPQAEPARDAISAFTELEKSPEHVHTYRISRLSLWNAASAGLRAEDCAAALSDHSRYDVPATVVRSVRELIGRFGRLRLEATDDDRILRLQSDSADLARELGETARLKKLLIPDGDESQQNLSFLVALENRGTLKQELIRVGWPVEDRVPLLPGDPLPLELRTQTRSGKSFGLRDYQSAAAAAFVAGQKPGTGYGTVVMPSGAGKTVVGMGVMAKLQTNTLIITTNTTAVEQWQRELLDKTSLEKEQVGTYTGDKKDIRPVTVATYQILVWRPTTDAPFPHFDLFRARAWGLIIYDEVHLIPAPVFRVTAEIQAVRRLGLTATLVREDGREADVFSLVGPRRFDVPWKELEAAGWIATAVCREVRITLPGHEQRRYAAGDRRVRYRIASENPRKLQVLSELIDHHQDELILVIGQYLSQLNEVAEQFNMPIITGRTPNAERQRLYDQFRAGEIRRLVVSKVANFAIDLPDASVAVQLSGSFGSRQEEAQRLGRILRPKERTAWFYTLVSRYTVEEEFSQNRQKFLTEQGYRYELEVRGDE